MSSRNVFPPEAINTLKTIDAELDNIDGNTDDVEDLLNDAISELQDIEADVEANTSELQDVNTELDSIDALIDELEDALQSVGTDQLRIDIENNNAGLATETTLSSIDTLIDELEDALASVGTDELRVDTSPSEPLDVSAAEVDVDINSQTLPQVNTNLEQIGGTAQSAVDVADKIDQIEDALTSVGTDQLRVDLQNNNAGTLPVEQQTPVKVEADDSGGNTAELQKEELGTSLSGTETALITYLAQALSSISNDELRVNLENDNLTSNLDIDIAEQSLSNLVTNLNQVGGTAQSGVDIANIIDQLEDALASVASDQLRVDLENNNAGLATETTLSTISNDVDEVETKLDSVISELQDIEADLEAERDAKFITSETISANGTIERELNALGGSAVSGQFISTGTITLKVQWLDAPGGTVIREQNVINNAIADDWKTFELEPTSPYINLILDDESGSDQTVNASYHYN